MKPLALVLVVSALVLGIAPRSASAQVFRDDARTFFLAIAQGNTTGTKALTLTVSAASAIWGSPVDAAAFEHKNEVATRAMRTLLLGAKPDDITDIVIVDVTWIPADKNHKRDITLVAAKPHLADAVKSAAWDTPAYFYATSEGWRFAAYK